MKVFFQLLFNVVFCTLLPLSVVLYAAMTLPLCFPEGYGANDYFLHFTIGSLPSWLFVLLGYFGRRFEIISTLFVRRLRFGHRIATVFLCLVSIIFATMTKVNRHNIPIILGITVCCLLPSILLDLKEKYKK